MIEPRAKRCETDEEREGADGKETTFLRGEEAREIPQLTGRGYGLLGLRFEHNRHFNRGTRLDGVSSRVSRALA